ncbi:Putative phenylacetic acid degradation protein PaaN [Mycobacteroides abscessus subsp. bolletii]|uniref:phenylacetic acid degradation bifunctional protein PaaZ n=1 Tax=Mycobacteroides abscessus TaxID=36809 RepID=UPI0009A830CF|nr:phenylacetic acid degradation bifunctional protein PaaZ [Mycobacteroides abscessus]SKG71260.1 Putative phenylacetic acid degradation protein PaaN [Mycobacteroides abscessus subsp. bolletii]SKH11240.1 Putative phenylacetic acid degradation protein PaaN [Mycobacteroides abscessus subsp. bolletii]
MTDILHSYICGQWRQPDDDGIALLDAATAAPVARISHSSLDYGEVVDYGRRVGGPALRKLTFHQRAQALKSLAKHLSARIEAFAELSLCTGATRADSVLDIDGGIGVLFVYASKGLKELPDHHVLRDGDFESLGKAGTFGVQHILTPQQGVLVQINAFNFPVWGMLEKFAPAFLAGVPSIVKPASQTAYLTELVAREIVTSGLIPEGALQLVCARPDGLVDTLTGQDALSVTGSHHTATALRRHRTVAGNAVRFTAEADSLNSSLLGADASPGSPEFDLFVTGLVTEMTQKAGQKCTAIRRAFIPRAIADDVEQAVAEQLAKVVVGDPRDDAVRMGPVVGLDQRTDVRSAAKQLAASGRTVFGTLDDEPHNFSASADFRRGAYVSPVLLRFDNLAVAEPHETEAFGPVSSLLPYDRLDEALQSITRGDGSLAASIVTADPAIAQRAVAAAAPWHGRLLVLNADNAAESTGHGAAVPHAVHGGPGRAGGGEELSGLRSLHHFMQRTAVQGSPEFLAQLGTR